MVVSQDHKKNGYFLKLFSSTLSMQSIMFHCRQWALRIIFLTDVVTQVADCKRWHDLWCTSNTTYDSSTEVKTLTKRLVLWPYYQPNVRK
ncbi:hypothetical protein GDO81_010580 [Engystomops pustulosus]|uniref:Uncharacterized protein n=1 Tax=Engystomops pustulosus TaxID=76066 RepID=A0AAV7C2L4_ENGPU|nr:hypothetical protein GDO81_010580 [Engystomops pustulosus]